MSHPRPIDDYTTHLSRRGGTGRRDGLKIRFPQGSVGSTPSAGRFLKVYGLFWIVAELAGIVMALFRHCCGVDRGLAMD